MLPGKGKQVQYISVDSEAALPDTPLDKTAQFFNQSMMSARVVEHHDRAMLNIV